MAHQEGKIARNPCATVEPPRPTPKGTHGSMEMVEALAVLRHLEGCPLQTRARWAVALLTGLRQSEALGLAWEQIDLDEGTLFVDRQQVVIDGVYGSGPPKTERSVRLIPLVGDLVTLLRTYKQESDGELLFGPRGTRADWQEWQDILEACGLQKRAVHACRSATASFLSAAGVSSRVTADILGHDNPEVTEHHYIRTEVATLHASMAKAAALLESQGAA